MAKTRRLLAGIALLGTLAMGCGASQAAEVAQSTPAATTTTTVATVTMTAAPSPSPEVEVVAPAAAKCDKLQVRFDGWSVIGAGAMDNLDTVMFEMALDSMDDIRQQMKSLGCVR
jgi:hypothetical protein